MADPDHRRAEFAREIAHFRENLRLNRHIQSRCRLIADDELRTVQQRDRNRHALAHAAGELVRMEFKPPRGIGNAHAFQHCGRAGARLRIAHACMRFERRRICVPMVSTGFSVAEGS